jgi:methylmalonyl-CoA/ethylmalonyl-CoA epimerase
MSKLRHVALIVSDPEKSAVFYEQTFGMTRCGKARRGIYMTDGVMNLALLKRESEKERIGVFHFGMWVDDLAQAEEQVKAAGATHFQGRAPNTPNSFYEVKYRDHDGIVFDITASGWRGAVKNVKPAD